MIMEQNEDQQAESPKESIDADHNKATFRTARDGPPNDQTDFPDQPRANQEQPLSLEDAIQSAANSKSAFKLREMDSNLIGEGHQLRNHPF